jgi:uncharacterized protein (TIGR02391 family)
VLSELRKKLELSHAAIYFKIKRIQEECLCTREDAANLLAAEVGLPVYDILSERELKRIRELSRTRRIAPVRNTQEKVREETMVKIEETPITPNKLYDLLKFHPRIVQASRSQFRSGHYTDAIFNALKCVEILVKAKSGLKGSGTDLMHKVFNEKNPVIKLNQLQEEYEIDEQEGFRFIYAGAMLGIRNPKAHAEVQQKDPYRTLEYLALASLLAKRIEEGIKVNE